MAGIAPLKVESHSTLEIAVPPKILSAASVSSPYNKNIHFSLPELILIKRRLLNQVASRKSTLDNFNKYFNATIFDLQISIKAYWVKLLANKRGTATLKKNLQSTASENKTRKRGLCSGCEMRCIKCEQCVAHVCSNVCIMQRKGKKQGTPILYFRMNTLYS